jgi:hypothetical protein
MAALDAPCVKKVNEINFWDASVIEKIRRSGLTEQLYKN